MLTVFLISLLWSEISAVCPGPGRIRSDPSVRFGELRKLPHEQKWRKAYDIEPDLLNPGGFLISNQHSVATISQQGEIQYLAGSPTGSGFEDDVGIYAGFYGVNDMIQINNGSEVIIADGNQCVRKLVRSTNRVTTIAGRCGADQFLMHENVTAREAKFMELTAVIANEEKQELFYLCSTDRGLLARHDLATGMVEPLISGNDNFGNPTALVFDSTKEHLFITNRFGIVKYNLETSQLLLVAGSSASRLSSRPDDYEIRDGPLFYARFGDYFQAGGQMYHPSSLRSILWLIPDKVLLVADRGDNSLKVVNLVEDLVSTVCEGCGVEPYFVTGNSSVCMVSQPETLNLINGVIYIGSSVPDGYSTYGSYLSLNYSQTICKQPILQNTNLVVRQEREEYRYGDNIQFSCREDFTLTTLYDRIQCVGKKDDTGTIVGAWDNPTPKCQPFSVDEVKPLSGQINGGTTIYVSGSLPTNLSINVDKLKLINFIRINSGELSFKMPTKGQNDQVDIEFIFQSAANPNATQFTYTYMPNPEVRNISRLHGIVSGGTDIIFSMKNRNSAQLYELKILQNSQTQQQNSVIGGCTNRTVHDQLVICVIPAVSSLIREKRHSATTSVPSDHTFSMVLLSDGVPVTDTNKQLKLSDTVPVLDQLSIESVQLVEGKNTFDLTGQNLSSGLTKSDYQVTFKSVFQSLDCTVLELSNFQLNCTFNAEANKLFDGKTEEVSATVFVNVAERQLTVGTLKLLKWDNIDTLFPGWAVAVIIIGISVIMVVIAVLSFRKLRTPCLQPPHIPHGPLVVLPEIIKGMLIDPAKLHLDSESSPIGQGHFGKVFRGQLNIDGNRLKTVAVKTIKDNEDVTADKLKRFLDEACFLHGFRHANILGTLGVVVAEKYRPLVVLPYMALGDLCSLVRRPGMNFTKGDLTHFGMQVSSALCYLDERRLLHRDIAARNCLVDHTFVVKLADFGMSKDIYSADYYLDGETDRPKPVKWMAIESLREGKYDSTTEVWSFGVLMWELFTNGGEPYPSIQNSQVETYISEGHRPSKPTQMPSFLFHTLTLCWSIIPSERPTIFHLKEFLEAILRRKSGDNVENEERNRTVRYADYHHYEAPNDSDQADDYVRQHTKDIPHNYLSISDYIDIPLEMCDIYSSTELSHIKLVDREVNAHYYKSKNTTPDLGIYVLKCDYVAAQT